MKTILELIDEQLEVIKSILGNKDDVELDLAELEKLLIDVRAEIEEKNVKVAEQEKDITELMDGTKKDSKKIVSLTSKYADVLNEADKFREVVREDIRTKAVWLKDEEIIKGLTEESNTDDLLKLKKQIDEKFNAAFEPAGPEKVVENKFSDSQLKGVGNF